MSVRRLPRAAALVLAPAAAAAAIVSSTGVASAATSVHAAAASCGTSAVSYSHFWSNYPGGAQDGGALLQLLYNSCNRTVAATVSSAHQYVPGQEGTSITLHNPYASPQCFAGSNGACTTSWQNDAGVTSYADGWDDWGPYSYYAQTISY